MASSSTVSSLGVGSGLDLNGLLTKLMQVEQQPLTLLSQQQSDDQSRISAYGTINSKLSSLNDAANTLKSPLNLDIYKATSTSADVANATTGIGAAPGTYNIHVGNLATAHTLASATGQPASNVIGTGTLRITSGTASFDVTIDSSHNTLSGIRDAINAASGNTTVNAAIITDSTGTRLTLTSKNTGAANAITVAVSETGSSGFTDGSVGDVNSDATGLSQLAYLPSAAVTNMTSAQGANDASLTINGIPVTSASNSLTTAINGVTLNLTKAGDTTLTIARDSDGINKAINTFVSAFNDAQSTVRAMTAYDAATKTTGVLNGESAARGINQTLARVLWKVPTTVTGTYSTLSDIGISLAKDGTLSVNSSKLTTAMNTDFASVKSVLNGYAAAVSTTASDLTSTKGTVTSRVNGLNADLKIIGTRAAALQLRLTQVEARYRSQFTALDTMVSKMNQTSTYLAQQLAKL